MKKFSIIGLILILSSCATPVAETYSTYDRTQVLWSLEDGTSKVVGDGFLSRRDGMLVKCSGQTVNLFPVSDYAIERFTNIYGNPNGGYNTAGFGMRRVDNPDSRYINDSRTAVCDVDGKFSFDNIPAGEYYVSTRVVWKVNDYTYEGGVMGRRITVEEGKTKKVSLTY